MLVNRLSKRYAKSLLEMSVEMGKLDRIKKDMEQLLGTTSDSRDLRIFLQSPVINADKKIEVFRSLFEKDFDELSFKFISIITRKGRESELEGIATSFLKLYNAHNNIAEAHVTTAYPLNDKQVERIMKELESSFGMKMQLTQTVDKSIIGGMTLRVGDKQYNGSIANKLQLLKRQFEDNLYVPEY